MFVYVLKACETSFSNQLPERMVSGCTAALEEHRLPGYALGVGARGCVTFASTRIRDYATMRIQQDADLLRLTWLHGTNRGLYLTPARPAIACGSTPAA